MAKKCYIPFILIILIVSTTFAKPKSTNFSGMWTLDTDKTININTNLTLIKINITQTKDSLLTSRTYQNDEGENYPFDENLTLDGKEHHIVIYDFPRKASAKWAKDGKSLAVESTTTYDTDTGTADLVIKETWTLSKDGALAIDFHTSTPEREEQGRNVYKKE